MQIAVLFDEQSDAHRYFAAHTATNAILGSRVLQASGRNVVIRFGTVLTGHGDRTLRAERAEHAFFADCWRLGDTMTLRDAVCRTEIFAWVISNIDRSTATALHAALAGEPTYLGLLAVNLSDRVHLVLYRMLLRLHLRVEGSSCKLFWRSFDPDARDDAEFARLHSLGFDSIDWEDIGARETIFDEFETPDHFARLESLRLVLSGALPGGSDDADDLLVMLEDLNPRLASTLGTAAASCLRGTSEEDFAQAGLSVRRYCEQLADTVFPAQPEPANGRAAGQGRTKNRLWAYAEDALVGIAADRSRLLHLGQEIDRLWDEANGQLHGSATQARVCRLIVDIAILSAGLLTIVPYRNRQPYLPYSKHVAEMLQSWLRSPASQ